MKTIIKPGKKEFEITCPMCGCQFKYEISDVKLNSVQCPDCFNFVGHPRQVDDIDEQIRQVRQSDSITVEELKHYYSTDHTGTIRYKLDPYTHYYESITPTCPISELTIETPTPIDSSLCSVSGQLSDNVKLIN